MKEQYSKNSKNASIVRMLIFFLLGTLYVHSQVFPVNVTPQVVPPYSLKLSEYGTAVTDKLILNLLLTDITESNRQVRLKFYLENNAGLSVQSSDVVIGANPIFLDGGVPTRLTNLDLQAYFSLQNLIGITPQQYSVPLPEGLYRFCFEVYDVQSGQQISRKSCSTVYLVLNDPPFLNLPNRDELVVMRDPQNIVFNWTPRHLNATNVQYEFTLTELWDHQMNPQAAFLASRPIYQTTTFANTLLYGPGETPLLEGKMYGWRVRAIVSDGISESAVFKNDGYSEIYHFTYSSVCAEPGLILAEAKGSTSEKILWQPLEHERFNVQYRKKDVENAVWFESGTVNAYTTIYNLEPGTTYEFRVGGQCMENGGYTYSQIYQFTTTVPGNDSAGFNCGITPEIVITNQDPLTTLVINDVFTAGDFPVTVKETNGTNGTYSGWGYIVVPYLEDTKLKVDFNEIIINTDYQLIQGIVVTDYDENWGGVDDISNEIDLLTDFSSTLELIEAIIEDIDELVNSGQWQTYHEQLIENLEGNLPQELEEQLTQAEQDLSAAQTALEAAESSEDEEAIQQAEEQVANAQDAYEESMEEVKEFVKEASRIIKEALKEIENENSDATIEAYQELLENAAPYINTPIEEMMTVDEELINDVEVTLIGEPQTLQSADFITEEDKQQLIAYYNNEILYNRAVVSRYFSNSYATEEEQNALAEELKASGEKLGNFILGMIKDNHQKMKLLQL